MALSSEGEGDAEEAERPTRSRMSFAAEIWSLSASMPARTAAAFGAASTRMTRASSSLEKSSGERARVRERGEETTRERAVEARLTESPARRGRTRSYVEDR